MKKGIVLLMIVLSYSGLKAQVINNLNLEKVGFASFIGNDGISSVQSIRLGFQNGITGNLDFNFYANDKFWGNSDRQGGGYIGYGGDFLSSIIPYLSYNISGGVVIDGVKGFNEPMKHSEFAIKPSLSWKILDSKVDIGVEMFYLGSLNRDINGVFFGLEFLFLN